MKHLSVSLLISIVTTSLGVIIPFATLTTLFKISKTIIKLSTAVDIGNRGKVHSSPTLDVIKSITINYSDVGIYTERHRI